jgi:hypothetical protein
MNKSTSAGNPNPIFKLVTGLLLIFMLGLAAPIQGFACHNGKNHGGPGGECPDPPPSDEEISTTLTTAHWTHWTPSYPEPPLPTGLNTVLELTGERLCGPGGSAPLQAEHAEYACDHEGEVYFNLTGGEKVGKKGEQAWCDNFKAITLHNSLYNYIWNGDCTTGDCWIHILNWAYQTHVITLPDNLPEPVGLLWIEAFADLPADFPPSTTEPNPYVENLVLDVNEVLVIYKAFGKNKTMVKCSFTQNMDEVVFRSKPVEIN